MEILVKILMNLKIIKLISQNVGKGWKKVTGMRVYLIKNKYV